MKPLFLAAMLLITLFSHSQVRDGEIFQQQYQYHISKATAPVKVDGLLDEAVWATAEKADSFWLKYPIDIGRPRRSTQVLITHDDKNIYFGFTAFDSGKAFVQSLKRDIGHDGSDGVAIILDPTNQRTNGFFFVVNAFNAQSEDQLPLGEENAWSWDNKWFSAVKRYEDRWVAEIAIPFKTLRYTSEKLLWGLNFLRIDTKTNEYSTWTHVPVNFRSHNLGYTGALLWSAPPPAAGGNSVFIPYITGSVNTDKQNNKGTKGSSNAGFDGKLALSSALNLDLTVNPDFSQVEVDKQVTNLTRFSIFFPERRTFFLENADLFSEYGTPDARPFYSRRIGLDDNGNRIPILLGARLTGNIDKSTRIGVMNIQTAKKGDVAAQNYTAASVQKRVLKRSVIKAFILNHESFLTDSAKKRNPLDRYGRNAGVEFNYNNLQGSVSSWASLAQSFKPGIKGEDKQFSIGGNYNGRNFSAMVNAGSLGTNFYTDMGFAARMENYDAIKDTVVRLGYKELFAELAYKLYPEKGLAIMHDFELTNSSVFNPNNSLNEQTNEFTYQLQFRSTSTVSANIIHNHVNLLFATAFTNETPLPAASYNFTQYNFAYSSDFRKTASFTAGTGGGGFYNGHYVSFSSGINLRKQPHVNVGLNAEYNKITLKKGFGETELFLLSSRVEVNFNTALFWTTFLQYNTQRNNFNINSRLQYRYRPMSDFFLVYTDNYFTDPLFKNKNRAIVFKLNYWLNL